MNDAARRRKHHRHHWSQLQVRSVKTYSHAWRHAAPVAQTASQPRSKACYNSAIGLQSLSPSSSFMLMLPLNIQRLCPGPKCAASFREVSPLQSAFKSASSGKLSWTTVTGSGGRPAKPQPEMEELNSLEKTSAKCLSCCPSLLSPSSRMTSNLGQSKSVSGKFVAVWVAHVLASALRRESVESL